MCEKYYSLVWYITNKQEPPFGVEICSDISLQTLSVPRSKQFPESAAWGKLWDTKNMLKDIYPGLEINGNPLTNG